MLHPKQENMLAFASGRADETDAESIYSHLAECETCTERVDALNRLRADFDGSWDAFIEEVGLRLAHRTARATAKTPAIALALRGILDGSRRLATAARDHVSGALEAGREIQVVFVPAYQGVADPEGGEEAKRYTEEASTLCLDGEVDEALERLAQAANRDPAAAAAAQLDFVSAEGVIGRVIVDASRKSVALLVYPDVFGHDHGTAVLELVDDPAESKRRQPLQPVEGAPYLLAEFEELPDGAFLVELDVD
jgi:hypothetical protein